MPRMPLPVRVMFVLVVLLTGCGSEGSGQGAGEPPSAAPRPEGFIWAWGANRDGELGNGTTDDRTTPAALQGLENVIAIVAAVGVRSHSLALKADGTVWIWGYSFWILNTRRGTPGVCTGPSGTNSSCSTTPIRVPDFDNAVAIASNWNRDLVLKSDGTVWTVGGLGLSRVPDLDSVEAISAGIDHNLALKRDGTVWAWGDNRAQQLGDGTTIDFRESPVRVTGLANVKAIAAGNLQSFALKDDGSVWTWGLSSANQLGVDASELKVCSPASLRDDYPCSPVPIPVGGLNSITAIAAANSHVLALRRDGTVWAWGRNEFGQLGASTNRVCSDRGTNDPCSPTPIQVSGLTDVKAIAAGGAHSLAVKNDGTVWAWGGNERGQLGVDRNDMCQVRERAYACSRTPVQVSGLTNIHAVAAGSEHSLALK